MSEDNGWEGLDDDSQAIDDYFGVQGVPASVKQQAVSPPALLPAPPAPPRPTLADPLVSPLSLGVLAGPLVSPLALGGAASPLHAVRRRGPGGPSLGALSPTGVCEVNTLAKLAYLFFNNVSVGDTQNALATLGVYRFLFNDSRATIAAGLTPQAQAALPQTIPDASWSGPMAAAMTLMFAVAIGSSNTAAISALSQIPQNMAQLATWFPTLRNTLSAGDVAAVTTFVDSPIPTGQDYGTIIGTYARADLQQCISPGTAPSPGPAPAPTAPLYDPTRIRALIPGGTAVITPSSGGGGGTTGTGTSITQASGPDASGGAAAPSSSGPGVFTVAFAALIAYGGYLAWKDSQQRRTGGAARSSGGAKGSMGALPPKQSLLRQDLGPLVSEFDRLNERAQKTGQTDAKKAADEVECIPGPKTKRSFSMDEWGGPGADRLNRAIFAFSEKVKSPTERPKVEHELEDTYYQAYVDGLRKLKPGSGACE